MDVDDGSFWGGCRDLGSWRLDLNADEDNGFEIAVDADDDDGVIVLNADEDSGCRGCPDRVRRLGCRRSPLMEVLRSWLQRRGCRVVIVVPTEGTVSTCEIGND